MKDLDPLENQDIKHLQLYLYLIPIVGFFPALWTLYQRQSSREQQAVSRQAVTLAIAWLTGYILLGAGAQSAEFSLRLLFMDSLLTSGYFLVSIWLMVRLSQRKRLRLPGVSHFADRVVKRHLS